MALESALRARAGDACELCGATDDLGTVEVGPTSGADPDRALLGCGVCRAQIGGAELDAKHWFCLQEAIWAEVPAVQVQSWRLLHQLDEHPWARDLLDQAYLEDDVLAWAEEGLATGPATPTVDSNGTVLADGDAVTLIKDLDVKGANFTAKRGTLVKSIRLTDDPGLVEGRVNKVGIVLKTEFLKKA